MVGNKILVKKKDPPVCPKFWYGQKQNSSEKKDPPVCPEFLCGRGQNSGEKERPSFMSLNFGTLWNKILVKKKDLPVSPLILAPYGTKFW